jgi:hypothetical protein
LSVESDFRQVLAEMSLLQYGKTQAFNGSGGKSENPDPRPSGEAHPMHEYWAERWTLESVTGRGALLTDAREALRAWKVRTVPVEDSWDEKAAILEDGQGFAAADVARRFQRSVTYVMRLRDDATNPSREPEFGMPLDMRPKDNSRERVLNLAAQGCTLRQIEMQTGVKRETVRRWMKEAT